MNGSEKIYKQWSAALGIVDKKLFEHRPESRFYEFKKLNNKIGSAYLSSDERLVNAKCPICDNYLIVGYDYMDKWCRCPDCKMDTHNMTIGQYRHEITERMNDDIKKRDSLNARIAIDEETLKLLEGKK